MNANAGFQNVTATQQGTTLQNMLGKGPAPTTGFGQGSTTTFGTAPPTGVSGAGFAGMSVGSFGNSAQTGQTAHTFGGGATSSQAGQTANTFGGGAANAQTGQTANTFGGGATTAQTGQTTFTFGGGATTAQTGQTANTFGGGAAIAQTGQTANTFGGGATTAQTGQTTFTFGGGATTAQTGQTANTFGGGAATAQTGQTAPTFGAGTTNGQTGQTTNTFGGGATTAQTGQTATAFGGSATTAQAGQTATAFGNLGTSNSGATLGLGPSATTFGSSMPTSTNTTATAALGAGTSTSQSTTQAQSNTATKDSSFQNIWSEAVGTFGNVENSTGIPPVGSPEDVFSKDAQPQSTQGQLGGGSAASLTSTAAGAPTFGNSATGVAALGASRLGTLGASAFSSGNLLGNNPSFISDANPNGGSNLLSLTGGTSVETQGNSDFNGAKPSLPAMGELAGRKGELKKRLEAFAYQLYEEASERIIFRWKEAHSKEVARQKIVELTTKLSSNTTAASRLVEFARRYPAPASTTKHYYIVAMDTTEDIVTFWNELAVAYTKNIEDLNAARARGRSTEGATDNLLETEADRLSDSFRDTTLRVSSIVGNIVQDANRKGVLPPTSADANKLNTLRMELQEILTRGRSLDESVMKILRGDNNTMEGTMLEREGFVTLISAQRLEQVSFQMTD